MENLSEKMDRSHRVSVPGWGAGTLDEGNYDCGHGASYSGTEALWRRGKRDVTPCRYDCFDDSQPDRWEK